MRITEIRSAGLRHGTTQGGWSNEIRPEDCIHTLIAVFTDEGITGWGSAFTNDELVEAALHVVEPLYAGENPPEAERASEKLHAHTFWMGRGGSITHAIGGEESGARFIPHGWNSALGLAADLQLASATGSWTRKACCPFRPAQDWGYPLTWMPSRNTVQNGLPRPAGSS